MASTSKSSKSTKHLIEKFCSVTGAEKETAKKMLEACNGNLQMAINMHVDTAEVPQEIDGRMSPALKTASAECFEDELRDDVRAPIPPTRGILVDEPFSFGVHGRRKPPRSIFDGFRDFEAETRRQEQELLNPSDTQNRQKKQTLEDLFRPPVDLMHKGTFESAREQGQINNKWIMVNVQNVQEFSCQMLNRDVWSNPTVRTIIEKHFVFFQVYHDSEEGQRYMQFYKVIEWPYIAIIDPRTGENLIVWHKVDAVSFCDLITEFLSGHPPLDGTTPPTPPKKRQKIDSIVDASEDSQLEAAIKASLLETARLQKVDDTEDESSQEVETFESDNEASSSNSSNSRIIATTTTATTTSCSAVNNINVKITNNNNNSNSNNNNNISEVSNENCKIIEDEKEVEDEKVWTKYLGNEDDIKSKVVLRFPDGKKEQLCLPASSKVKALLLYVESLHFSNEKYELVTNFPRRQLSLMDHNLTLKEASIFPQETIFVQAR